MGLLELHCDLLLVGLASRQAGLKGLVLEGKRLLSVSLVVKGLDTLIEMAHFTFAAWEEGRDFARRDVVSLVVPTLRGALLAKHLLGRQGIGLLLRISLVIGIWSNGGPRTATVDGGLGRPRGVRPCRGSKPILRRARFASHDVNPSAVWRGGGGSWSRTRRGPGAVTATRFHAVAEVDPFARSLLRRLADLTRALLVAPSASSVRASVHVGAPRATPRSSPWWRHGGRTAAVVGLQ